MSSLVELVFSAVGAEPTAALVQKVAAAIDDNAKALARDGVASVAAAQGKEALTRALREQAAAQAFAANGGASLRRQLEDMSATVRDKLTPSLDPAAKHLLALGVAAVSVHAAYRTLEQTLGDGAHFQQLSARTGENVRTLVILEQQFKNAGLGSEYLGRSANMLERVLDGVDAHGNKADATLRKLNLSVAELKPLGYAEQLAKLAEGFQKIENPADRAGIAMALFGRGGGEMLQVLGNPESWALAEKQAGGYADRIARDAQMFRNLEHSLSGVQLQIKEMAAAALEQLAPALERAADASSGISAAGFGTVLGVAGPGAVGGIAALWGVDKFQLQMGNVAEKFKGKLLGSIADAAAQGASVLATGLTFGLAAGVAVQIVAGVLEAMNQEEIRAIFDQARQSREMREPFEKDFSRATTAEAMDQNRLAAQMKFAALIGERDTLQTKDAAGQRVDPIFRDVISGLNEGEQARLAVLNVAIPKLATDIVHYSDAVAVATQLGANQLQAVKDGLAPLVAQLPHLREVAEKAGLAAMSPADRLAALSAKRAGLQSELAAMPAGINADEQDAWRLSRQTKIDELAKSEAETRKQIAAETKKAADEEFKRTVLAKELAELQARNTGDIAGADRIKREIEGMRTEHGLLGDELALIKAIEAEHDKADAKKRALAAAREQIDAERTVLDNQLAGIREQLAKLEGDYTRTAAEKWGERKQAIEKEIAALKAMQRADQTAATAAGDKGDKAAAGIFAQSATRAGKEAAGKQSDLARLGPDPSNISQQMEAATGAIRNQMKTLAEGIGNTWKNLGDTMRTSLGTAFYDMLSRSKNFKDAAGAMFASLARSLGQSASQMAADWIMNHVTMDKARKLFHALGLAQEKVATVTQVGIHAGGEGAKTAATGAGAGARGAIRLVETVFHGIQVGIRTAMHIAGEILQTTVTLAQSALRIAATIAEALVSIIKAAAGAMSAMASIPYVGPFLAIAAAAAIISEGSSLIKGAREQGGPVEAGSAYLVGEKRPEVFVPHSDGYIFPNASQFSFPAPALPRTGRVSSPAIAAASAAAAAGVAGGGGNGGSGGRESVRNTYILLDPAEFARMQQEHSGAWFRQMFAAEMRRSA